MAAATSTAAGTAVAVVPLEEMNAVVNIAVCSDNDDNGDVMTVT